MNSPRPTRQKEKSAPALPARGTETLSPRNCTIIALSLAAIVVAIYSPALSFQFILDDHRFTADPRIQSAGHIGQYFTNYVWAQFTGGPPSFYRPVFLLWMRTNFILCELSPWGWHLLSIAKHLAVAMLLGLLAWRLLRDRAAAVLAATLFAVHPAQTESVAWVTVPDPLMSAGVLGALLLYLRHTENPSPDAAKKSGKGARSKTSPQTSYVWLVSAAAVYFGSLLAKETAIVLPVAIFILAFLDLRSEPPSSARRKHETAGENPDLRIRLVQAVHQILPFVLVTIFYLLLRLNALSGKLSTRTQQLPGRTVVLSWPAIVWFYLKVLLWPAHSYAFADPALQDKFSLRDVLLPTMGEICILAIFAAALFWISRKAHRDLAAPEAYGVERALVIGSLLLILPILPALNLNALNPGDFLHGRYTYLPLAGLTLLLSTGWHVAGKARIPFLIIAGTLAVVFAGLTLDQEHQWKDDLTLFNVASQLAPHNVPVAQNLANARVQQALQLAEEGRCGEAVSVFEQVTRDFPQDWYAWAALGDCLVQLKDLSQAEESFHKAADLSHDARVIEQWQQLRTSMGLPILAPK